MWVNPRYKDQYQPPTPPAEQGRRLATFPRNKGTEEFRVTLAKFNDFPYLSLRCWSRDPQTGAWWPMRGKGLSVKISEVEDLIAALRQVEDLVASDGPRTNQEPRQGVPAPATAGKPQPAPGRSYGDVALGAYGQGEDRPQFIDRHAARRQQPRTLDIETQRALRAPAGPIDDNIAF